MKIFLLLIINCFLFQVLCAQPVKNNLYAQVGANALFTSFNYERDSLFHSGLAVHAGAGIYGVHTTYLTIPVGLKYFFKKSESFYFALGMGATYCKADVQLYVTVDYKNPKPVNTNYFSWIPSLEARKYTKNKWMFSWIAAPVFNHNGFIPLLGLSIGKGF